MLHVEETFFTSVGCMDGRVQCPVKHFGQDYFHAKYADTITEAGLVGIISKESADSFLLNSIKKKILISLEKHYSKGIIVHGHEDCAGNPVDDELHREHVRLAVGVIRDMIKEKVPVHGVFAKRAKGRSRDWEVEQLDS